MFLGLSNKVQNLQVIGDSKLVIDWLKQKRSPKNIIMMPLYEKVIKIATLFQDISLHHIFWIGNEP